MNVAPRRWTATYLLIAWSKNKKARRLAGHFGRLRKDNENMYSMYCTHSNNLFRLIVKICSLMAAKTLVSSEPVPNGVLVKKRVLPGISWLRKHERENRPGVPCLGALGSTM